MWNLFNVAKGAYALAILDVNLCYLSHHDLGMMIVQLFSANIIDLLMRKSNFPTRDPHNSWELFSAEQDSKFLIIVLAGCSLQQFKCKGCLILISKNVPFLPG